MANFITSIQVNELLHLKNFRIDICNNDHRKHLILTGPNGTGKTILLKSLLHHIDMVVNDKNLYLMNIDNNIKIIEDTLAKCKANNDTIGIRQNEQQLNYCKKRKEDFSGEIIATFKCIENIAKDFAEKKFIVAYYGDDRQSKFVSVTNPEKPNLKFGVKDNKVDQFVKFLVDLKFQQALAKNEGKIDEAKVITDWFESFENTLKELFKDETLHLDFDYKTYRFTICEKDKIPYEFSKLSAGYSAALDIIADLMLKMQNQDKVVRAYNVEGIVLIDEIETHLHLALQSQILPLLARLFPKIQFIITSHSPFILNSLEDVTVFDLISRETVTNLTDYSYDTLAEGYFGVKTESGELSSRLKRIEELLKKNRDAREQTELDYLIADMKKIPDAVAPEIKTRLTELLIGYKTK